MMRKKYPITWLVENGYAGKASRRTVVRWCKDEYLRSELTLKGYLVTIEDLQKFMETTTWTRPKRWETRGSK